MAGLRVFRLLALRGQLEQKQIADLAMLPPKDTRELLYRMLAGGFVLIQVGCGCTGLNAQYTRPVNADAG